MVTLTWITLVAKLLPRVVQSDIQSYHHHTIIQYIIARFHWPRDGLQPAV